MTRILSKPGDLPALPATLAQIALPVVELGQCWFRTHAVARPPSFFGRAARHRFDDPQGEYGVLYVASEPAGALIETFGQLAGKTAHHPRPITMQELAGKALSEFQANRALRLVDLCGPGLARLGADARLFSGDHATARSWSRAFYSHPDQVDGIYYPARHDPSQTAAASFNESLAWADISRRVWGSMGVSLTGFLFLLGFELRFLCYGSVSINLGSQANQLRFKLVCCGRGVRRRHECSG